MQLSVWKHYIYFALKYIISINTFLKWFCLQVKASETYYSYCCINEHCVFFLSTGPPVILIPPTDTVLNMSQDAKLKCQAEADPPNMTYVWKRQGEDIYHIEWVLF